MPKSLINSVVGIVTNKIIGAMQGISQLFSRNIESGTNVQSCTEYTNRSYKDSGNKQLGSRVVDNWDMSGTLMLLDVLIRKITEEKYISSTEKSISTLEARGCALTITNNFKEVLKKAAKRSECKILKCKLDFDLKVFPAKKEL